MKKDRISMFILLCEIVAIVAMHASKDRSDEIAQKPAPTTQQAPIFSITTLPSNNVAVLLTGYSY
jgi:hypothetical protein